MSYYEQFKRIAKNKKLEPVIYTDVVTPIISRSMWEECQHPKETLILKSSNATLLFIFVLLLNFYL